MSYFISDGWKLDQTLFERGGAVAAFRAVFPAVKDPPAEIGGQAAVFDHCRIEPLGVVGFEQFREIAGEASGEIGLQYGS